MLQQEKLGRTTNGEAMQMVIKKGMIKSQLKLIESMEIFHLSKMENLLELHIQIEAFVRESFDLLFHSCLWIPNLRY